MEQNNLNNARFGRVVTAMVTPFGDDGSLDIDKAIELAKWLTQNGSDGLVVAGTTGEGPTLTDKEKLDLFEAVANAVTVPVIANTGSNDTAHSVELTEKSASTGVAGILAVTPYYSRPPQSGIADHFRAIAEAAASLPVLLYDIPIRTGRKISDEVLIDLVSNVTNIVGTKDATGDVVGASRLMKQVPQIEIYSGDDVLTLAFCSHGAVGVIGVATHWIGQLMGDMIDAIDKGDLTSARTLHSELLPSFNFVTSDRAPNPIPAKAICNALGFNVGNCRLPLGQVPGIEKDAKELLLSLGQI
ncbi:MAG: 4-hydroxy-tetrahydrodipicolinate synthase [Acidimicrobiales bacterium]|nr:4-hydroxy-tetrahydrodipicolinate synthase [Acidimicrobiales bacterium]